MFYDLFKSLCDKKGVSVSRACIEMGLSRSIAAKWKNTKTNPSAEVIPKIAQYFNVSTDYLLGNESESHSDTSTTPKRKLRSISRLEDCDITPEQDEEISNYIDYLLSKRGKE